MSTKPIKKDEVPLSESIIPKIKEGTIEEVMADLRALAEEDPERVISRNFYRVNGKYAESAWNRYFGTFHEFKRQTGIVLTRQQHALERQIAKHASVDHYRALNAERADWADKYERSNSARFKTMVMCSDLHDVEIDPFFLRVLLDTIHRVQPDVVSFVGDVFDLPEFGKYSVDPREWDVVERIRFAQESIFRRVRERAPNAQMDLIEGNHEARLLRLMADATPALRAVLSELHGMTISKLLGLDQFEMNYIAKGDLAAYTERDFKSELRNNYKVYWNSVLAHHFPEGKDMGLPGVNGHHHRHVVWSNFSPIFGPYEWHQLGCGHRRDASYCNGEKWHMGFAIVNVDTKTHATAFDYIPVTDFAVSGGKWYHRESDEVVSPPSLIM